jgi:hypothetical protein
LAGGALSDEVPPPSSPFGSSNSRFGDVFSPEIRIVSSESHILTFDYLGLPSAQGVPGNLGGFAGIADETPGTLHRWMAGTTLESGAFIELIDDGSWHTYEIEFTPSSFFETSDGAIRLMFEEWFRTEGIPGDAFFEGPLDFR